MDKPPIGVKPYWISAYDRVSELAQAIDRYSAHEKNTKLIKLWAKEIINQCEMVEELKQVDETIKTMTISHDGITETVSILQ